jgi:kynurenine formamidase
VSEVILKDMVEKVRNWGKWGPDDELGTLNYITPQKIAQAARLVTRGNVFALGIPLQRNGPQSGTRQRFNPIHLMFRDGGDQPTDIVEGQGYGGSDDVIIMPLQSVTQWDSLAHVFYAGKMYNGYDAKLVTSSGTTKNSIAKTSDRIVSRGVLLDIARSKGQEFLDPGYAISVDDLEHCAAAENVRVETGDILLVRTGHIGRAFRRGDWGDFDSGPAPGLSFYTASWLHAKQIAAVAVDNYAVEVRPSELPPFRSPLHIAAIPNMGLTLGEIFYLEELAADCWQDRKWEFLFVAPPLPVTAGVGSPINPYAIK